MFYEEWMFIGEKLDLHKAYFRPSAQSPRLNRDTPVSQMIAPV